MFQHKFDSIVIKINHKLEDLFPKSSDERYGVILEAMRYAALSPGKRLRGFLVVMIAELFNHSASDSVLTVAAVIEMLHSYSLVHDDLPALDNDDYRRGKLSCHKKFGESIAILTGDALLTYAFEILSVPSKFFDDRVSLRVIAEISRAIGCRGMIAGQVLDISLQPQGANFQEVLQIHNMKTALLFGSSSAVGGIIGGASIEQVQILRQYGFKLGLLFQLADDCMDFEQDIVKKNMTIINVASKEQLEQYADQIRLDLLELISCIGDRDQILMKISHLFTQNIFDFFEKKALTKSETKQK